MIKRISIISTAVLAALLIAGMAWATPDDLSSSSSSTTSTTLVQNATAPLQTATGSQTYEAEAAGRVTVDQSGASLSISKVTANANWVSEIEMASGREVEVKFVNGTERIDFQAELEDGLVKTRIRVRALDSSTDDISSDDSSDDSNDDSVNDSDDSSDDSYDSDDDSSDDSNGSDDDSSDDNSSDRSQDESSGRSDDDGGNNSHDD